MPFTGLALIPGARPGQNVTIRPSILRIDKFLINGNSVRQRIILAVFVKVTQTVELNVLEDVTGPLVLAKKVVASASRQVLVESVADLAVPAKKVHEIQARITDLFCEVIPNKVILTGCIHKQIFFVGPDDVVHHQAEDIPFTTFVDVPGAQAAMVCQADGLVEHITWNLFDPVTGEGDSDGFTTTDPYVEDGCPVFCKLAQKTVIQIVAVVSEEQQIHVAAVPVTAVQPVAVC